MEKDFWTGFAATVQQAMGFKQKDGWSELNIREKYFVVVIHWHKLPKEVLDVSSLVVLKAKLDGAAWSGGMSPYPRQGIGQDALWASLLSQTILCFYDSMIIP